MTFWTKPQLVYARIKFYFKTISKFICNMNITLDLILLIEQAIKGRLPNRDLNFILPSPAKSPCIASRGESLDCMENIGSEYVETQVSERYGESYTSLPRTAGVNKKNMETSRNQATFPVKWSWFSKLTKVRTFTLTLQIRFASSPLSELLEEPGCAGYIAKFHYIEMMNYTRKVWDHQSWSFHQSIYYKQFRIAGLITSI